MSLRRTTLALVASLAAGLVAFRLASAPPAPVPAPPPPAAPAAAPADADAGRARPVMGGAVGGDLAAKASLGVYAFDAGNSGQTAALADAGPAINAVVDQAIAAVVAANTATGTSPRAEVRLPAGVYTCKTPVYVPGNYVKLVGEGENATILRGDVQSGRPVVCFGMSSQGYPTSNPFGPSYRPDGFGVLDSAAAPTTGVRRCFSGSTKGDGALVAFASPLSHGPRVGADGYPSGWFGTSQLTLEFLVVGPGGGAMPSGMSVLGAGTPNEKAYPFCVDTTDVNTYRLTVSTQAAQFGAVSNHQCTFSTGAGTTGPQRIAVQIDLVAGKVQAYALVGGASGGTQLAVSGSLPPAGSYFNENLYFPFSVNYDNFNAHGIGCAPANGQWSLYGLNLSTGLRYADRGAGQAQVAHPQVTWPYAGAQTSFTVVLPGAATGGTYTLTIGGKTATLSPTATAAEMTTALTGLGLAVSAVSGPTMSSSGNVRCYQVTLASGTVATVEGMCDGSNLTGQALDDVYRYFPVSGYFPNAVDYYSVAFLPFTEDAASAPRMLTVQGGWRACGQANGAAIGINPGALGQVATGVGLEKLSVLGGQFVAYGSAVLMAAVLDVDIADCTIAGGTFGLANFPFGANYTTTVRRCNFGGSTACVFGYWNNGIFEKVKTVSVGKSMFLSVGSDIITRDVFASGESSAPYAVILHLADSYGGTYSHENTKCDFEGATSLGLGLFAFEAPTNATSTFRVTDVYGGGIGDSPVFRLRSSYDILSGGTAHLDASHLAVSTTGATVDVDGRPWHGEVRGMTGAGQGQNSNTAVVAAYADRPPAVRVVDDFPRTPPRHGREPWAAGTAPILAVGAPDGLFERYALVVGGTHGTTGPPQWAGRDPVQSSPSALGAYAVGHTAIAATLSGRAASQGFLCDKAAIQLANALFKGQALGAPATCYFGLYPRPSTVADGWDANEEIPTASGYGRVAMANTSASFTTSSAGSKSNAAAITWPAATTAYTVGSIGCFASATDTAPLFAINLATPLVVAVGQAPTIPIGALTFANAPAGDVLGGLTDYGWGKCLDAMFGGAALGAPAAWAPALTTVVPARTTTAPTEPTGGYARPSLAAGSGWSIGRGVSLVQADDQTNRAGEARATSALGFGVPTGPWGSVVGVVLMDATSGGNAWAFGPLAVPCSPTSGWAAPTFAAGAFVPSVR